MDKSYYSSFEVSYEDKSAISVLLQRLNLPLTAADNLGEPSFKSVKFNDSEGKLLAPVDILLM